MHVRYLNIFFMVKPLWSPILIFDLLAMLNSYPKFIMSRPAWIAMVRAYLGGDDARLKVVGSDATIPGMPSSFFDVQYGNWPPI
jgi:hypothetical protein